MGDNYSGCHICPRDCGADRRKGTPGFCGQTEEIICARAALHMWEEPCISGKEGSGAVFFSGCNLRCVFCQNYEISRSESGLAITSDRLTDIFLELQDQGANNINLVTPTHYVDRIIPALTAARRKGLTLPIVYNTSGYEKPETIERLGPYVDIWLPDFKYHSSELAAKYSRAADYFDVAAAALDKMVELSKARGSAFDFDERGIMRHGVIVRHLCLPGQTADSKRVLRYLHERYGSDIYISIMNQYTPVRKLEAFPELNRRLTDEEYERVTDFAERIGIELGFVQEGTAASESFIPAFDNSGVLPGGKEKESK